MIKKRTLAVIAACLAGYSSLISQTTIPANHPCVYNLTSSGSPYIATSDVIIPPGCSMNVSPGVEIIMPENAHIIIRGTANFIGSASQPIHIHAADSIWGNIFLDSTLSQKSTFSYVTIENARNSVNPLQEPGAIYGYYSSMEVNNCHFLNNLRCVSNYKCPNFIVKDCLLDSSNRGEKLHGQYCDGALIEHNILHATNGDNDAIDFDASNNITIRNNILHHGGDDGIDIGQCDSIGCNNVLIEGNYIYHMFNKGVSNGEYCLNVNINHNIIAGCQMGLGAKSGAHVVADHNTLYNNGVGVMSYDHINQIWGPGHMVVTNSIIMGGDTTFYVDSYSYLSIAYSLSPDVLMPGTGNVQGNPAFISPSVTYNANFGLMSNSAAIDMGDPSYAPDPDGSRSDVGALYFGAVASVNYVKNSNGLSIYPNPSNGRVHIRFEDQRALLKEKPELSVTDFTGREIYKQQISPDGFADGFSFDLGKQAVGVYYLQVRSENTVRSAKLILE